LATDLRLVGRGLGPVDQPHGVWPALFHSRNPLALPTSAGPALVGLRTADRGGWARRRHSGEPRFDLLPPWPASQL